MAIRLTTTKECGKFAKVLVFGKSGVGKTKLIGTAPKPIIISGENGLLSLNTGPKIPVIEVKNHLDLDEAYNMIMSPKCAKFETVSLDSVSEIAENCLQYFKDNPPDGNPDPRAAHGAMIDALMPILKKFRDINDKHVYFIAQLKRTEDQYTGIDTFAPSAPGRIIGPKLPYWFDFVLPMRIGEKEGGGKYRYLQTQPCLQYVAKSRGENLRDMEPPNLTAMFKKVLATPTTTPKTKPAPTTDDAAQIQANAEKQAKIKEQAELAKAEEVAKKKAAAAKRKKAAEAKKAKEDAIALAAKEAEEAAETSVERDADARAQAALASLENSEPEGDTTGDDELDGFGVEEGEGDTDDFPGDDGGFPE